MSDEINEITEGHSDYKPADTRDENVKQKNMDNPEYGVEELSGDLGMVRMSLYRKLQSITGHTPTDFIRSIRLKRAAQLLQGSQLPIVEIANRVGFSSPSYFSKCFREMFGMLPKQYAEESGRKE